MAVAQSVAYNYLVKAPLNAPATTYGPPIRINTINTVFFHIQFIPGTTWTGTINIEVAVAGNYDITSTPDSTILPFVNYVQISITNGVFPGPAGQMFGHIEAQDVGAEYVRLSFIPTVGIGRVDVRYFGKSYG